MVVKMCMSVGIEVIFNEHGHRIGCVCAYCDICSGLYFLKCVAYITEIIKYHHEHYDGNGYPYGLKGEEIPLGSRIIAIADAYDSMISNRAYRKSRTPAEALEIIRNGAGVQFDPYLVQIFENILPDALKEIEDYEREAKLVTEHDISV